MEYAELEKTVATFLASVAPVTAEMMVMEGVTPGEAPAAPAAPTGEEGEACITKDFKNLVGVLKPDYIGLNGGSIKELVMEFLDSLPECVEVT